MSQSSPPTASSAGLDLVVRSMERDVLAPERMLKESAAALNREGAAGSRKLAGLLWQLSHSRSAHAHHALFVAGLLEPTPELITSLQEVLAARPLRPGDRGSFPPEIIGGGCVGWTDGTHHRLRDLAREALAKLQAGTIRDSRSASPGPDALTHSAQCWFCEKEPPADGSELTARLRRLPRQRPPENRNEIEPKTETVSIMVPRCPACAAAHTRRETLEHRLVGAAFILFAGLWAALAAWGYPKAGFAVGALVGIGLGGYLAEVVAKSRRFLPAGVKAEIEKVDFPPARRLESEGWTQTESKENFYTQSATDWERDTKSK